MINYNTFTIDPATYQIYRNGQEYFTAWHQRSWTLEQAKATIDQSMAAKEAMDKLPDLGRAFRSMAEEFENGSEAIQDYTDRVNQYFEMQLNPEE